MARKSAKSSGSPSSQAPAAAATASTATTAAAAAPQADDVYREATTADLINKVLRRDETWAREDLVSVLFWLNLAISFVLGPIFGVVGLQGTYAFATYFVLDCGSLVLFYKKYLGIDEEEYGGHFEIFKEFFMSGMGIFLLTWILTYTAVHHS